ncbi:MAG: hypothetical protein CR996_00535 [Draconibacterium sp.]|nr:MAG: hypothetical protein CR996_00535 [Draconibacterium sp.]
MSCYLTKIRVLTAIFTLIVLFAGGCEKNDTSQRYKLVSIHTDKESLTLEVGGEEQIKAIAVPAVANQPVFQWSSANEYVATVSNQGLVKALATGETVITVRSSEISTTVPVIVNPKASSVKTYSDTIVRITLKGADYSFVDSMAYGVYIPTRKESLRGVLILQHGCGMEQFGITRPYDLQYQAFARKWRLAVIETALYGSCELWRDPDSGTANALFEVLDNVGIQTGHPELNTVPWLLFGHSAGGYWTLAMLKAYPERIMAAVCYSAAFDPKWDYPETVAKIPVLLRHAGPTDANDDGILCWQTAVHTFIKLRKMDATVSVAYNAGQNHNLSYIRYIAIPFYEAVMKQRMPNENDINMRDIDRSKTWLGDTLSLQLYKESEYIGNKGGLCLFPDETTAKNWKEFVTTGTVTDKTPPPPPYNVKVRWRDNALEVTWEADADIESGIARFNIYKNGKLIGKIPETGTYQIFDTNGDNTVPVKVPEMKFEITGVEDLETTISVEAVNHFNLVSEKTEVVYK